MLSCFKNLLRPKKAVEQDESTPEDHVEKHKVLPAVLPQSIASEGSKGNKLGDLVAKSDRPHRNLWQEAFAKLNDDQRDLLSNIEKSQGPSVVQSVAKETEKKYLESCKGGCKGKKHNNLRAAAEKILLSVLRSKKLIDAGVAFDPTGHAASAWTIISLGLQIMENDIDRRQALFEASGIVTDTLARCAAIEACYRDDRDLPDSAHLEDTIVEVYLSILEFSAEMASQGKMNIGQRVLKSINSLDSGPLQDLKKKLSAREEDLQKWNHIIGIQHLMRGMEPINLMVTSILDNSDQVMQQLFLKEERTILKWLYEYDFSAIHRSAILEPEPGTGLWIFDNPNYKKWEKLDSRLLWLYGNSGSGKTVLCSQIIKNLQDLCAKDASYALAYWYFSYSSQRSLDLYNLLCSIIRQLCANTQTLPDKLRELWKVHHTGDRPTRDSLEEALDVLIAGLTAADQTAFIVLDALDECPLSIEKTISGPQQISERKDTLRWVREFTAKHENVRVMILSRDENDIRASFNEALQVDVARGAVDDLHLFISNCINRIVEERDWKTPYIAAMSSRVEGVSEKRFRWASLMQHKFSKCLDRETMQQALETLPETLEDMYADVLTKQIPKEYRKKARDMLMWLTYSVRPLTLRELASVALLPKPTDVRRVCPSSLITFSQETLRSSARSKEVMWRKRPNLESEEDTIVKFDHFSVKEYLVSELLASSGAPVSYFFVPPLLAHLSIAKTSVSFLLDTNGSHFTEDDIYVTITERYAYYDEKWEESLETKKELATEFWPGYPLLEYSTFWHNHVLEADAIEARLVLVHVNKPDSSELKADTHSILSQAEDLRTQIHKLFCNTSSQSFENWVLLLKLLTDVIPYYDSGVPSPMWLASLLNLPDNVRRLLQSEKITGERGDFVCFSWRQPDFERTPIQIAAKHGFLKVLSLLLGTEVRMEQSDFNGLVPNLEQNASTVLSIILKAQPHLVITEHMVKRTRRTRTQPVTYSFILSSPDLVHLSKSMFAYIVQHFEPRSFTPPVDIALVQRILRRGEDIGYGRSDTIEASTLDDESGRYSELAIDRCKPPSISQDVLALMVLNDRCGADMLANVVVEHYKDVQISQDLLVLMVANEYQGARMLAITLKHYKDIHINQNLLVSIFANSFSGAEMFAVVLEHRKGIHISQDLLVTASTNCCSDAEMLFDRIFEYDASIEVSDDVLKAAAGNRLRGADIFSAILSHNKKTEFSEDTLCAAAGNTLCGEDIFSVILSHNMHIGFSEDTLKAAARNEAVGGKIFWAILSHNKNIVISTDLMGAMKEQRDVDLDIMNLLIDHASCEVDDGFESQEEMMKHGLNRAIHYHRCRLEVTREIKEAAIRWEPDAINFLNAHKRPNVTFIRSTTQAISEDPDP